MSNKEVAAVLARYFKTKGCESAQLIDNDEKVVVGNFGDCRLQIEPKAARKKIRLCAYATSNREQWKVFFREHGLLSKEVINRNTDGDSGVVRESFMILGGDWEKHVYEECVKMKNSVKNLEDKWPSGGRSGGKNCRNGLLKVDKAALKKCFQVYLCHKKLLDLIRVCKNYLSLGAGSKTWTTKELNDAVDEFQKRAANGGAGLGAYLNCNAFDILRMGGHEIRHSNMLAWLLDATETHGKGDVFLQAFLEKVLDAANADNGVHLEVVKMVAKHKFGNLSDYKVFREDEHEDIKLMSETAKTIIVVENKWNAEAGENQLTKYRQRTDAECKDYGDDWKAIYVFLTKEGRRPPKKDDDDHWIPISHRQIITMVQHLYGRMEDGSVQKMIVDQYLQVLKRDADLIRKDDQVVKDVGEFCKDCDAIRFLPFVGEAYFQRVFDEIGDQQWVRDEELDAGRGTCIVFCSKELSSQLERAKNERLRA